MDCNTTEEELIALTTGEMGGWRAWRLRRHLARCADCRAAFAMTQVLMQTALMTRELTVEAEVEGRLYASLLTRWQPEAPAIAAPRNRMTGGRTKRATFATALLTVAALVTPVIATVVYVRSSREHAERLRIGAEWQKLGWMTQQDYVQLRQMIDGVRQTGTISDRDLDWSVQIMQNAKDPGARARVLGMFTLLRRISPAQKRKLEEAIAPLLASEAKLDRAYALRVQAVLDKN